MHGAAGQQRVRRYLLVLHHRCHWYVELFNILTGHNGHDTGHRRGRVRVDGNYFCMRIRRAQESKIQHSWQLDVVYIASSTGNQNRIFNPQNRCADQSGRSMISRHEIPSRSKNNRVRARGSCS
jgi:hypothetical protein